MADMTILIPKEDFPAIVNPVGRFIEFVFYSTTGNTCIGRLDTKDNEFYARQLYSDKWLPAKVDT